MEFPDSVKLVLFPLLVVEELMDIEDDDRQREFPSWFVTVHLWRFVDF